MKAADKRCKTAFVDLRDFKLEDFYISFMKNIRDKCKFLNTVNFYSKFPSGSNNWARLDNWLFLHRIKSANSVYEASICQLDLEEMVNEENQVIGWVKIRKNSFI